MNKSLILGIAALSLLAVPAIAEDSQSAKPGKRMSLLEKVDVNKDGAISKEEFMSFHEQRFNEMDIDKNGTISKDEVEARRAEWKKKMTERREKAKAMKAEKEKTKAGDSSAQ